MPFRRFKLIVQGRRLQEVMPGTVLDTGYVGLLVANRVDRMIGGWCQTECWRETPKWPPYRMTCLS